MALSESFGLGDTTFMNLESQIGKALRKSTTNLPTISCSNELDAIEESPTNCKANLGTSRSRIMTIASHHKNISTSRSRFHKSKSESTLDASKKMKTTGIGKSEANGNSNDNYSEFFKSDFSFELPTTHQSKFKETTDQSRLIISEIGTALNINEADGEDSSQMNIKCSFEDELNNSSLLDKASESKLDLAICSEDMKCFFEDDEAEICPFSNEPNINATQHNELKETSEYVDVEEVNNIDNSSFIFIERNESNKMVQNELDVSKNYLSSVLSIDSHISDKQSVSSNDRTMSSMAFGQLKWTPESQSEENQIQIVAKKQLQKSSSDEVNINFKSISAWGLPETVRIEYEKKGIKEMFDWQIECLKNAKVILEHKNLVYSAPTSAGKTLISEILLIKTIIERCKKALYILPFISVVREKMSYLQELLTPAGYRVEGFYGGYNSPGAFDNFNVAICTIEKANSIVNKLLEQNKIDEIGMVVVDEIHLISDVGRGYILELLLAKVLYMSKKNNLRIQVITMSATLANVELLRDWLEAELHITDFRPVALQEMIKIGTNIFDCKMQFLRELNPESFPFLKKDSDNIAQLCIETLSEGCSVIVFCPSKDWCESLSLQLAEAIHCVGRSGSDIGNRLRIHIKRDLIDDVKRQLRDIPTGLDSFMEKVLTFACAFHHAGLTTEERDIIEMSFKSGALKILVATSTLSSGVNLPARRVIIRTPLFGGKQMNSLTYRQMIGRAGRTGKDTLGESILICTAANANIGKNLINADLMPISSCLEVENRNHLKRALLEVISSSVATTLSDIETFFNCTLLSKQNKATTNDDSDARTARINPNDGSPSLSFQSLPNSVNDSIDFLIEYEFIRMQVNEKKEKAFVATRLGKACLASSMPPSDGLILFAELQRSRRCFVLESELHAVYLVTPYSVCYQMQNIDWLIYLDMWEKLSPAMKKVGELVGVKESFLARAMRGQSNLDLKLLQIHKRFYIALALNELVNEAPINKIAVKYKCSRGLLQTLQQMSSTFAGIVAAFCNSLNWSLLALIVSQFKERLFFGVHHDLVDLMRLPELNQKRARSLFDAGITNLIELANADSLTVENILYNSLSFDSAKRHDEENEYEANRRNNVRAFFITGKAGLTVQEASKMLINEARVFLQYEIGAGKIRWSHKDDENQTKQGQVALKRKCTVLKSQSSPKATKIELVQESANIIQIEEKEKNEMKATVSILKPSNTTSNPPSKSSNLSSAKEEHNFSDKTVKERHISKSAKEGKDPIISMAKENFCDKKIEVSCSKPLRKLENNSSNLTPIRRSPRIHLAKSTRENILAKADQPATQLFMNDTSLNNNTGIIDVITEQSNNQSPLNKSADEIVCSQKSEKTHATPWKLRSSRLEKKQLISNQAISIGKEPSSISPNTSASLLDKSTENAIFRNPIQLNSSHILSTSKNEAESTFFNCMHIVDICGNAELFQMSSKEITESKRFGFSLGVQKHPNKLKPLIGSNLLINQADATQSNKVEFRIDENSFIAGIGFAINDNVVYYLNLQTEGTCKEVTSEMKLNFVRNLFQSTENSIIIFNSKDQLKVLRKAMPTLGAILTKLEDPKIANWLLTPNTALNFAQLAQQFAPECKALVKFGGSCGNYSSIGLNANNGILARVRCSVEACISIHILKGQIENLQRIRDGHLYKTFTDLEMPLQLSLCNMETYGFPSNEISLKKLLQQMVEIMKKLELKIYEIHGSRFNLASTAAVAKVVGIHRKGTGRYNTSKQVLEKIDSPIAQLIIAYRKLSATLANNIQPLLRCVVENRIHGQSITFTSTGRISMCDPNLQNVAKDFDIELYDSEKVIISCRSAFFPPEGLCLISSDFCQLEMRILAHLSQDPNLVQVMKSDIDLFVAIASKWNKIAEDKVTEQIRNNTKQICYAIVYGMGMRSLAESLKCSEQDAISISNQFHMAFPRIRSYVQKIIRFARENGYVETITGRRRFLNLINSTEPSLKNQAERQAVNSTIQGSAADIAKSAILRMEKNIAKYREKLGIQDDCVNMVLHLHDELIFEVPNDKAMKIAKILSITMENCVKLSVPLRVKLKIGKSWGDMKEVKL